MQMRPSLIICTVLASSLLAGCTDMPDLDDRLTPAARSAPYPALVPVEPLLAQASADQQITDDTAPALQSRVAGLRARAARLRGSVVDGSTRSRMGNGVDTTGL